LGAKGVGGVARRTQVSFLTPDITRSILHGRQPAGLNSHKLMAETRAPIDWHEQCAGLGICAGDLSNRAY
jgi:hypothetical protein